MHDRSTRNYSQPNTNTDNGDPFREANINWLFTKAYYAKVNFDYILPDKTEEEKKVIKSENEEIFERRNGWLCNKKWNQYSQYAIVLKNNIQHVNSNEISQDYNQFELTVENPGLIFGTGITHESGNNGEFKIGFLFDHVTGLVVIPGHSIKGVVRSCFGKEGLAEYIQTYAPDDDNVKKIVTIAEKKPLDKDILKSLEKEMFTGIKEDDTRLSVYEKDIFHEAFIVGSSHTGGTFLGKDAITPHTAGPLINPTPLPFIKLLPNTQIQFNFSFKDGIISASDKKALVMFIIKEFGIGAKTNVGYGQFK